MKKLIALFLAVAALFALTGGAAAQAANFPDITDPQLARDVAVLQMLGVVSGDNNGNFNPYGTLTRAQFCKMAVMAMGKGDQAALYQNRTIFPDVRSGHWARGYINYAVSGENKLIIGNSDGTFQPESPVTGAQAVTILMRMLGYTDADAGMLWPDGYLALAADKGLTSGVTLAAPGAPITRANAAKLFVNLLGSEMKAGGLYAATLGTTVSNAVIKKSAASSDGTAGSVETSAGTLQTARGVLPAALVGLRGTLVLDQAGRLLTLVPDRVRQVTVIVSACGSDWIKDENGVRYDIPASATAYTADKETTYSAAYINLEPGTAVSIYYNKAGTVDAVYINTVKAEGAVIYGTGTGSIAALTGGDTGYKIYKNGAPADMSAIQQYDVITYNPTSKILTVTDFRLTGAYESCWPSTANPSEITVFGLKFTVLPSAAESLAKFKIGDVITLLLTGDGQVAGAVSGWSLKETAIGVVTSMSAGHAEVELFNGMKVSGTPGSLSVSEGELVSVSSYEAGKISLKPLTGKAVTGKLNVTGRMLGTTSLSPAVRIFERVGTGPVTQISLEDLKQASIPSTKVLYSSTDSQGRVDMLVLDDVTGDRYVYGLLEMGRGADGLEANTISVVNSEHQQGTPVAQTLFAYNNHGSKVFGGVAFSSDGTEAIQLMTLTRVPNIQRTAFRMVNGTAFIEIAGVEYQVAENVQCYNMKSGVWYESLDEIRAVSDSLTVYYDRAPWEGGKIRIVVAE